MVPERYGMIEAAGDANVINNNYGMIEAAGDANVIDDNYNLDYLISTDEYGIVDFEDKIDYCFLDCLKKFIKSEAKLDPKRFKSLIDFRKYEKYFRVNKLWRFVCSNTSDRVLHELDEDYGNNIDVINSKNKNEIKNILFEYFCKKIKVFFSSELNYVFEYSKKIESSYADFVKSYDQYVESNYNRVRNADCNFPEEDEDDIISMIFNDEYQKIARVVLADILNVVNDVFSFSEISHMVSRKKDLSIKIKEFNKKINSCMNLENDDLNVIIDDFVSMLTDKVYAYILDLAFETPLNDEDFKLLVESISKMKKVMPGTISIVISEVKRVVSENGIKQNSDFSSLPSEIQVDDVSSKLVKINVPPKYIGKI